MTELDYQQSQMLLTRDAPFGTDDTPSLTEKIIGGRYVSVLERPYGQNVPRYEKLSLVSDKPNHIDPRTLADFSRRYNKPYQDPFVKSQVVGRPTNMISKRPDSKDISSRYGVLPPIDENRLRNHVVSTVFEPEPWTRQFNSQQQERDRFGQRNTNGSRSEERDRKNGMKPLYDPAGTGAYGSRGHSDSGVNGVRQSYDGELSYRRPEPEHRQLTNEEFLRKLQGMLPQNVFLPSNPLVLSEDDEVRLIQVIAEELRSVSPLKLRDVYLDIANTADKNLSSFCQYQELYYSLNRQMVSIPGDLLQVTAAMFVSPDRNTRDVNYEKFLSFVGLALKQAEEAKHNDRYNRPRTPVEKQVDNYFADSEHAKLVSTIQQQLDNNDFVIDLGKLEAEMLHADKMGKGILDLRTVLDVCYQLNIPLQNSILNRTLQRCRLNSYEDKYRWRQFMDILRKAQAVNRANVEPVRIQQSYRDPSPLPPQYSPTLAKKPVTPLWMRDHPPADHRTTYREGYDRDYEQGSREEVISRMDQEIKTLERNYEDIKERLKPKSENAWFNNFMEFANALYKQDERYEGDLPADDVYRWTKMYNETGNLGIEDHQISKALSDSSKSGKVNIHTYLMKLGNVATHDKIV